jgi:hypothetical protein
LALGIFICLLGLQCLVIEKAVFANLSQAPPPDQWGVQQPAPKLREVVPPDWAPWTFLGGGVLTIIYSFTIPRRLNG